MVRLSIVLFVIGWYVSARSVIYFYFLGHASGANRRGMEFFEWWWSWVMALPVTILTLAMIFGLFMIVIPWVVAGFKR